MLEWDAFRVFVGSNNTGSNSPQATNHLSPNAQAIAVHSANYSPLTFQQYDVGQSMQAQASIMPKTPSSGSGAS